MNAKKILGFIVSLAVIIGIRAFFGGSDTAVNYNDMIVDHLAKTAGEIGTLYNYFENRSVEDMQKQLEKVKQKISDSRNKISENTKVEDDSGLKDAALELMGFYENAAENELQEMIDLISSAGGSMTSEISGQFEELVLAIEESEKPFFDKVVEAQQAFAKAKGFKLEEKPSSF